MHLIGQIPMKCKHCEFECELWECNYDDITEEGDGNLGCPQPDCGGTMKEMK